MPTLPEPAATPTSTSPAARSARPGPGTTPPPARPAASPGSGKSATVGTQVYRDGTYVGTGNNRIGAVEVAVTVRADLITDVQITRCTTHYPQRYIDNLPQEVLARQSAQVDIVSGATKSSQDFQTAVQQALAQARI